LASDATAEGRQSSAACMFRGVDKACAQVQAEPQRGDFLRARRRVVAEVPAARAEGGGAFARGENGCFHALLIYRSIVGATPVESPLDCQAAIKPGNLDAFTSKLAVARHPNLRQGISASQHPFGLQKNHNYFSWSGCLINLGSGGRCISIFCVFFCRQPGSYRCLTVSAKIGGSGTCNTIPA